MRFQTARFQRRAAAIAVGMLISSVAYAQSSEGSIHGKAKPGDRVTITSADSGATRQIVADANGDFTAAKLPPGAYQVVSGGISKDINVAIGSGTAVDLTAAAMNRVVVRGVRSAIDVSSVESNTVFTADQMAALPVSHDVNAIAILAPGVVKGDPDLGGGGLPAFAGASVAENGYYINGFDVTNIRNFLSYANLPFDAIGAEQVKSGGYGAEFGRSLGGVISMVTKRGTNTWKGGGAIYWAPSQLKSEGKNVASLDPDAAGTYTVFETANKSRELNGNVYVGGPIIKDRLFFFGLLEGRADTTDTFGQDRSIHSKSRHPNGMVKIDFTPNDMHRFEFTGITNKVEKDVLDYWHLGTDQYATSHLGTPEKSTITSGGHTLIGKYTGYLTDDLTVSVLGGKVKDMVAKTTGARVASLSCPTVYDVDLTQLGCWKTFDYTGWKDPKAPDDEDGRTAFRLDLDYTIGSHTLRGGIDSQKFTSKAAGGTFSGAVYWRYFRSASGAVNGVPGAVPAGSEYVRQFLYQTTSGAFDVKNDAYYLEDNWKMTPNFLLYGGLRSESFNNKNGDGVSFVKADNLLAPRLGFSWDVNGDASAKLYGNVGRYYIPVASNTNIRATHGELFQVHYFPYASKDPVTGAPVGLGSEIGTPQVISDGSLPNPATIADMNLKPMSQDEYILGFQHAIAQGWSAGVKGTYRKINNGMDDYCSHLGFEQWAADNGHANFDSSTMAGCMLVNPGNDVTLMVDIDGDGKLQKVTFPASYIGLGKYTRTYKALEFTLERPFNGTWGLNASYTWSKSRGTAEGYVNSIINQEDAGISQDFDFPSLTRGADGDLSNDRRHVIKAYGTYMLNDTMRLGFNSTIASGRPISCIGFVPYNAPDYSDARNYSTASSFYCLNDQGKSELHNRGTFGRTPWTSSLDLSFAYLPKIGAHKVTLQVDVFNVFNQQQVTEVNETRDYSRGTTTEAEGRLNMNWKRPTSYQEPRSVRFTARYEF